MRDRDNGDGIRCRRDGSRRPGDADTAATSIQPILRKASWVRRKVLRSDAHARWSARVLVVMALSVDAGRWTYARNRGGGDFANCEGLVGF